MEAFGRLVHSHVPKLVAQATLPRLSNYSYLSTNAPVNQVQQPLVNSRTECDYEELSSMLAFQEVSLIDVRTENELLQYGSIPGAIHIPLSEVKIALQMSDAEFIRNFFLSKPLKDNRNLIFFARGPNASSTAVEIAHKLGFKSSRQYTGGWEDYCQKTGVPLKKISNSETSSDQFTSSYTRSSTLNNRFYM